MILKRQKFNIEKKCVVEKLIIQTPFRYGAIFPNEACFLYFKSGQVALSSAANKLFIVDSESILLKCGNYFADLLQNTPAGTIEVVVVHFYPDLLKEIFENEIHSLKAVKQKAFNHTITNTVIIHHFVESLDFYFNNKALVTPEILTLKIKELVLLLLQTNESKTVSELIAQLFTPRLTSFKKTIQAHLFSNLSVAELAQLSGLSLSSFKRKFFELYQDTPANLIQNKKIEKAQKLLLHSDSSISEICYQVGFSDASNFTKIFKKHTSLSPMAFRKNHS